MDSHKTNMQRVYSTTKMAQVVAAAGSKGFMNFGLEDYPGHDISFKAKQRRMVECVLEQLSPAPGDVVADFGCGKGGAMNLLLSQYPHTRVVGFNIDPAQLEVARQLLKEKERSGAVEFRCCDVEEPFSQAQFVDKAYSIELLSHINNKAAFFRNLVRSLKPGGRVVLAYIVLARTWQDYAARDQQYMLKVATYFKEDPRNFLTRRLYEGIFREAGLEIEKDLNVSDMVYPHRHFEMVQAYRALTSSSLVRRKAAHLYWRYVEGCDPEMLQRYLGDVLEANQSRLYEYYVTTLVVRH